MSEFTSLQFLRFFLYSILIFLLFQIGQTGINLFFLLLSVGLGIFTCGRFLRKTIGFKKTLAIHFGLFLLSYIVLRIANSLYLGFNPSGNEFLFSNLSESLIILLLFYSSSFLLTWSYWTKSWSSYLELSLIAFVLVSILSAHRNYQIDAPKEISSLSWKFSLFQSLNLEPQHMFIAIGSILFLFFVLFCTMSKDRQLFGKKEVQKSKGKKNIIGFSFGLVVLASMLSTIIWKVNTNYSLDLSRVANGVGSSGNLEEGKSNLGFHQSVSSTKSPTALVRLETDYKENPWKPMLYFREGVLSEYNGKELVKSKNNFNKDLPIVRSGQSYIGNIKLNPANRTKLVQNIYLLSEHKTLFAVDFPSKFTPIKNPTPEKFKSAYQVTSHAPAYKSLHNVPVGNPDWNNETWAHFLRAPGSASKALKLPLPEQNEPQLDKLGEDLRYMAMAKEIAKGKTNPVDIIQSFISYLNKETIYTKKPEHQVTEKGDPVAPYLFDKKDKKGFCVHFAHALTYMFRLNGIPARIATGYLADLKYAKDGHILLQTGDRHAWAEAYFQDHGWLVFDLTPDRAEGNEDLAPDESLLQELMGKLSPVEELLVPEIEDEQEQGNGFIKKLAPRLGYLAILLLILFILTKLFFRYGYKLPFSQSRKIKLAYLSFASTMQDLNQGRKKGETRIEYAKRIKKVGIDSTELTKQLELENYSSSINNTDKETLNISSIEIPLVKRIISFLNPSSLFNYKGI